MGQLIGKWIKKLTDDACLYALNALACGTPGKKVAEIIKEKYNIDITPARLSALKSQKKWQDQYTTFRNKYLVKVGNIATSDLPSKRTRLEIAKGQIEFILQKKISVELRKNLDLSTKFINKAILYINDNESTDKPQGLLEFVRQTPDLGGVSDERRNEEKENTDSSN